MGASDSKIFEYNDKCLIYNNKNKSYTWITYKDGKIVTNIKVEVNIIVKDILDRNIPVILLNTEHKQISIFSAENDNIIKNNDHKYWVDIITSYKLTYNEGGIKIVKKFQTVNYYDTFETFDNYFGEITEYVTSQNGCLVTLNGKIKCVSYVQWSGDYHYKCFIHDGLYYIVDRSKMLNVKIKHVESSIHIALNDDIYPLIISRNTRRNDDSINDLEPICDLSKEIKILPHLCKYQFSPYFKSPISMLTTPIVSGMTLTIYNENSTIDVSVFQKGLYFIGIPMLNKCYYHRNSPKYKNYEYCASIIIKHNICQQGNNGTFYIDNRHQTSYQIISQDTRQNISKLYSDHFVNPESIFEVTDSKRLCVEYVAVGGVMTQI
jgi:hypothetical protein